jgi:hypothetical protein
MTTRILRRCGASFAALALFGMAAAETSAQRTSYAQSTRRTSGYGGAGASTGSRLPFSQGGGAASGGFGRSATAAFGQAGGMSGVGGMNGVNSPFGQTTPGQMSLMGTAPLGQTGGQQFDQGFVGRDAEDVRGTFENLSGRDRRDMMMDMMVENYNEQRESRRRWRDQQNATPPVRVRLTPSPDLFTAAAATAASRAGGEAQLRVNQLLARRGIGAEVQINGGTAILRGAVSNEREAQLAAQLAALEPGVSNVQSELTMATPAGP